MAARNNGSARRRSVDGARPKQRTDATAGRADTNSTSDAALDAFDFDDPVTGDVARADENPDGSWVLAPWKLVSSGWLFDLAKEIGLRDAYALKENPRKYLAEYIRRDVRRRPPADLPTGYDIGGWRHMLLKDEDATAYLRDVRGLSPEIIAKAQIGYDGKAFTIPIKDVRTRELVNLRRRYWPKLPPSGAKYQGLAGRTLENGGVTIYPGMPGGNALVLCAGEFDALVLWRHGLPGITVTSGAATRWRKEWAWMVKGKRVAVIYDADPREEEQALSRAAELRAAGADAWRVRLSKAGLGNGEDLTDWFVDQGRSQRELLNLINSERHGKLRRKKVAA
jgi:hypothetical protein